MNVVEKSSVTYKCSFSLLEQETFLTTAILGY